MKSIKKGFDDKRKNKSKLSNGLAQDLEEAYLDKLIATLKKKDKKPQNKENPTK